MSALTFVILCLAAFRLTRLIVKDSITDAPRLWVEEHLPRKIDELVNCMWCASVWCAAGVVYAATWFTSIPLPVAVAAAVSAVVGLIAENLDDG